MKIFIILTLISIFVQLSSAFNFDLLFPHEKIDKSNSKSIFYFIFFDYYIIYYFIIFWKVEKTFFNSQTQNKSKREILRKSIIYIVYKK